MAVIVEWHVRGATLEQMYAVEALTQERGETLGRPPYAGCMFLAVTASEQDYKFVTAWRTEAQFRDVLDTMLGPDLATQGLAVADVSVATALSMAIPGTSAP